MADAKDATRGERFEEFLRRLCNTPCASSFDEAYAQLCDILTAVEDEMTSIPCDPSKWQTDGRMYPPQMDSMKPVPGRPDMRRFRSKQHNTLIGDNGAIEIKTLSGDLVLFKPGADGRAM